MFSRRQNTHMKTDSKTKTKNLKYYQAIGRRKTAVANVRLYIVGHDKTATVDDIKIKAGEIYLNKKPIEKIFSAPYEKKSYLLPLTLTQNEGRFAISIKTEGGGRIGQLEAIIHGLARALESVDTDSYRSQLKKHGFLTRDPRKRERRKVGTGGRARRAKQSPKR